MNNNTILKIGLHVFYCKTLKNELCTEQVYIVKKSISLLWNATFS